MKTALKEKKTAKADKKQAETVETVQEPVEIGLDFVHEKALFENLEFDRKRRKKKREPLDGVVYNRIVGAECPSCHMPKDGCYIHNTMPWEDGLRIRYHVCRRCGSRFKSIEEN